MDEKEESKWQFDGGQTPEDIGMPQHIIDYFMSLVDGGYSSTCLVHSPYEFICTREMNHVGVHVAHGFGLCAIWADKEIPFDKSSVQAPNEQVDDLRSQFQDVQ